MIYNSERYNDTVANLANFGRLYTWWSAVNVPEGDDVKPAKDTAGFVQGVCPEGWHIPTVAEMQDLRSVPEEDLHSTDFWVLPNANTNSTGFSEVPGGKFSAELDRFEGLYTNSYMWTDSATSSEWVVACNSRYFCNKASEESVRKGDGLSVRCVRVYEICSEVVTIDAIDTAEGRVKLKGMISDLAGTVESSGFVWGLSDTAITNIVNSATRGADIFSLVEGVNPCDTIWFAAFAKTSKCTETIYGDTLWFRFPIDMSDSATCAPIGDALPCPGIPVVYDHEGNEYNTVKIGNQCWTKENMRCETSPKGHLKFGENYASHRYAYYYGTPTDFPLKDRGYFYNWGGAMDTVEIGDINTQLEYPRRGICPEGWHIPSNEEWMALIDYVKTQECYACGDDSENVAKSLASKLYWNYHEDCCAIGNDPSFNNATGFSAVPVGVGMTMLVWGSGYTTSFWSSTLVDFEDGYRKAGVITFGYGSVKIDTIYGSQSLHQNVVRCIKDSDCPEVSTIAPDECNVSDTTATLKGKATRLKGETKDHGFVWGTSKNNMTNTLNGTNVDTIAADGTFEGRITNMPPCGDTLYYMAYAKQSLCDETVYGDTMMIIVCGRGQDAKPCLFTPTVTDHEGNVYNTVQIGTQCWMKENMRVRTLPSGRDLTNGGTDTSSYVPYFYDDTASTNTIPLKDRGYYYNWAAALDTTFTTVENVTFHNRRGICPEGWHIPSSLEFTILAGHVESKPAYFCNNDSANVGKSMSSAQYWISHNPGDWSEGTGGSRIEECAPSVNQETNNATGFSGVPSGYLTYPYGGALAPKIIHVGNYAMFWLSSESYSKSNAAEWMLHHAYGSLLYGGSHKSNGNPVRCIKDECFYPTDSCPTVTTLGAIDTLDGKIRLKGSIDGIMSLTSSEGFVYGSAKDDMSKTVRNYMYNFDKNSIWAVVDDISICDTIWYAAFAKSITCDEYVYGDTLFFVAKPALQDCGKVYDHEGNEYNTVKLGNQCWTKENMRCRTSPKGYLKPATASSNSDTVFYYALYSNNDTSSIPFVDRGILYNWPGALDTTATDFIEGSFVNRRGICPEGWHIPSKDEWETMLQSVKDNLSDCYDCGENGKGLAKALSSQKYWEEYDRNCTPGNNPKDNNESGFSAVPSGGANDIKFFFSHQSALFWTSTSSHEDSTYSDGKHLAYQCAVTFDTSLVYHGYHDLKWGGRSVRCVKDEQCIGVATAVVDSTVTSTSVTVGGKIYDANMDKITSYGVYYGDNPDPINNGYKAEAMDIDAGGNFWIPLQDLLYCRDNPLYVVAFAESSNCAQPVYGQVFEVILKAQVEHCGTVTDVDGNVYNTVKLGSQCWMQENLRVTRYQKDDGTPEDEITLGTAYHSDGVGRMLPEDDSSKVVKYGYLYSWLAAMNNAPASNTNPSGVRGACPVGWHVPSNKEWNQLQDFVKSQYLQYGCNCDSNYLAKSFCSTEWDSDTAECAVGNNPKTNNATGFSAQPASVYTNSPHKVGYDAWFWSSREYEEDPWGPATIRGWAMCLRSYYTNFRWSVWTKGTGASVRCVRDESVLNVPRVSTSSVNNVSNASADFKGIVSFDGGADVTERGFCYATTPNPTTDDSKVMMGNGTGEFMTTVGGLVPGTLYCVRAFATNSEGTAYGNSVMVMPGNRDSQPCEGTPTMQDADGNVYNTVQIGDQCWMKENLRVTKYADGTLIGLSDSLASETVAYRYCPGGNTTNVEVYGYLYNWAAVMNGEEASNTNPNIIQGICPTGWHMPTQNDFDKLLGYVRSQSKWNCNDDKYQMAKYLAANTTWASSSYASECAVNHNLYQNNSTGFSAVAAGNFSISNNITNTYAAKNLGNSGSLWVATYKENNMDIDDTPLYYFLNSSSSVVGVNETGKRYAHSVRCLKDN
ncbi:MAG: FISUMP domain-containing protein [Bacteroidales bacterium]|nr:FISUMP domain-containing protein [Bacteroidales bacterium]